MTKNRGGNNGSEKWIEKTTAAFRNLGNELNACVVRDEMERIWQKVTVTYLSVVCHVLGSDSYNSNEKNANWRAALDFGGVCSGLLYRSGELAAGHDSCLVLFDWTLFTYALRWHWAWCLFIEMTPTDGVQWAKPRDCSFQWFRQHKQAEY